MKNSELKKKVVLITGGSGGLGLDCSKQLLENDAIVICIDKKKNTLKNKNYFYFKSHLKNEKEIKIIIKKILNKFKKIDILINAIGIFSKKNILQLTEKEISKILYINFSVPALIVKFLLKNMILNKNGKIINITSIAGVTGGIYAGDLYAASKAALINFTKSIAKKYGHLNIYSNCINAGPMSTPMTNNWPEKIKKNLAKTFKIKNYGKLENVKDLNSIILFLCTNKSRLMQGSELNASGGII